MKRINRYTLAVAISLLISHTATAATLSTDALISLGTTSYTSSDTRPAGTSQSSVTFVNGNPEYYSRALSDESGRIAAGTRIDYNYAYDSSGSLFDPTPHVNMATASWSNSYAGTGTEQVLNFNISQGMLEQTSLWGEESTLAGYGINILLNGTSIWSSHDEIRYFSSVSPGETFFFSDYDANQLTYTDNFGFDLLTRAYDPYSGELSLGTFATGENFEISYEMTVYAYSDYFIGNDYVMARFGDPLDLSGTGGMTASVSSVPIPAAVYLFGSGLIGLAGIGRCRK